MTIRWIAMAGGESLDALGDGFSPGDNDCNVLGTGWSVVTSPKVTGVGALRCAVNGSQDALGNSNFLFNNSYICGWELSVTQDGAPSLPYALAANLLIGCIGLEVDTNSKVHVIKITQNGVWATRTDLSGASATALDEDDSTFKTIGLFLDPLTLGTSHVWGWLFIDGVQQWSGDCGAVTTGYSFLLQPVANAAINVTVDDAVSLFSTSSADAPHLTDWPMAEVWRQLPIGETSADSWWKDAAKNNAEYTEWDDAAGDDGDTTYNWQDASAGTNKYQRSDGQTAATVGIESHTIIPGIVDIGTTGPIIFIVHRSASGSKWEGAFSIAGITGGPTDPPNAPGASYESNATKIYRSSGAWTPADLAAIEFGVGIPNGATHDEAWRVTMCMLQWCAYINSYDHTDFSTPSLPGGVLGQAIFI